MESGSIEPLSVKHSSDLAYIRQLCYLGLGAQAIMPALLDALHKVVPSYHVLDGMVRDDGRPVGAVLLHRGPGDPPFTKSEEQLLASFIPYIANAFRATPQFTGVFVDSGEQGMIILNQRGKTLFMCPGGRRLLFLSTHPEIALDTVGGMNDYVIPPVLMRLVKNLRKVFTGQDAPVAHHQNPWGKFVFRAHWLEQDDYSGDALIGVNVRREEPLPVKLMRAMLHLPLSATQREVCLLLAEGLTRDAIARRMDVSLSTATDHVRKIYDKLDVHSYPQLMHKLSAEPGDSALPRHSQIPPLQGAK